MRVHPAMKKRSTTAAGAAIGRQRKLRRLPHVFGKVLEFPFASDADVSVYETVHGFQFVVATDDVWDDVRAHAIEIHPGVMKVVVRNGDEDPEQEFELDRWRFRLPPCTRPALATAELLDGELIVTVPKAVGSEGNGDFVGGVVSRKLPKRTRTTSAKFLQRANCVRDEDKDGGMGGRDGSLPSIT